MHVFDFIARIRVCSSLTFYSSSLSVWLLCFEPLNPSIPGPIIDLDWKGKLRDSVMGGDIKKELSTLVLG